MNLDDLRGRATITLPEAGQVLGIGRDAAYAAAARGEIPSLRCGRRLLVPVPRLLELLGVRTPQTQAGTPGEVPAVAAVVSTADQAKEADSDADYNSLRSA